MARSFRLWDVRPGERTRTALMALTVLLVIAGYTTTKAVRDALFLASYDLKQLAYVMLAVAGAAGFVASVLARVTARMARHHRMYVVNGFIAVTLSAMPQALRRGGAFMPWLLYFWTSVFGLLVIAEFWLMASDLFHAREARRLFPLIGAGAIAGGIAGGAVSGWLARPLGSANLLYVVAFELLLAAVLAHLAWRRRPEAGGAAGALSGGARDPRFGEGVALARGNPYVRKLALMTLCMTVCMTFVQWQYKGISKHHFASRPDDLTSFFGVLAAAMNLGSLALQLFVTPRLLERWGVRLGLRLLPAGIGLGALLLLSAGRFPQIALVAAAGAALLADGLRFSVDKASVELLYVPLPRALKDVAKPFIDTALDRLGGAAAAVAWLALAWFFQLDHADRLPYVSLATLLLVVVWLRLVTRARRGYVEAYRHMLRPRSEAEQHPRRGEAEALLENAFSMNAPQRTRTLRELARLQRVTPAIHLDREAIDPLLECEVRAISTLQRALDAEGVGTLGDRRRQRPLLTRVLEEKLDEALERVARLLALVYPAHDIRAAWRALKRGPQGARAVALELLDNLLDGPDKSALLRTLDEVALGGGKQRRPSRPDALADAARLDDPWLREVIASVRKQERSSSWPALEVEEARC